MKVLVDIPDIEFYMFRDISSSGIGNSAMERIVNGTIVPDEDTHIKFIPEDTDNRGYTDSFRCSNCNGFIKISYQTCRPLDLDYNYCPYCGGKANET